MRKMWVVWLSCGLLAILTVGGWWLFRSVTYDDPVNGPTRYAFLWGEMRWGYLDRNQDGIVDGRIEFDGGRPEEPHTHLYSRQWDDADFDGVFELYSVHLRIGGHPQRVLAVDTDADGEYDELLVGRQAWQEYHRRVYGPRLRDLERDEQR